MMWCRCVVINAVLYMLFQLKMQSFGMVRLVSAPLVAVSWRNTKLARLIITDVFIVLEILCVSTPESIQVCWSVQIESSLKLTLSVVKIRRSFGIRTYCPARRLWKWVLTLAICLLLYCAACLLHRASSCSVLDVPDVRMGML